MLQVSKSRSEFKPKRSGLFGFWTRESENAGALDFVHTLGLYRGMCMKSLEFRRPVIDVKKISARLIDAKYRSSEEYITSSETEFQLSQKGCMCLKNFVTVESSTTAETSSSQKSYVCKHLVIRQQISFDEIASTENLVKDVLKCLSSPNPKAEYDLLENLYGSMFPTSIRLGGCFHAWSTEGSDSVKVQVQSKLEEFTKSIDAEGQFSLKSEKKSSFVETKTLGGDPNAVDSRSWFKSLDDPANWAPVEYSCFVPLSHLLPENIRDDVDRYVHNKQVRYRVSKTLQNELTKLTNSKTLRIGVFGIVGAGKSSFCNTFRSLFNSVARDYFDVSKSGFGSNTKFINKYTIEVKGGYDIEIVDYPGITSKDTEILGHLVSTADRGGFSDKYNLTFYPGEAEFIRQRQYGNVASVLPPLEYFFGKANIVPQNDKYKLDALVYIVKPPNLDGIPKGFTDSDLDKRFKEFEESSAISEFKNACKSNRYIICFTHLDLLDGKSYASRYIYRKLKLTFENAIFVSCLKENRGEMAKTIEDLIISVIDLKRQAEL